MISTIFKLLATVKHLKLKQIYYLLLYRFRQKPMIDNTMVKLSVRDWKWTGLEILEPSITSGDTAIFLNDKADISDSSIWNDPRKDKLWLYNLHYFDDLNSVDSISRKQFHPPLVIRWINENPVLEGNGWEPYTISLRLVNWIKWYNRSGIDSSQILESIDLQAAGLVKQLEYHILGNHLFENAKALVFVGSFLKGGKSDVYLKKGLHILDQEIKEQFLSDGAHFELSPMYHAILLWDVADLICLAQNANLPELNARIEGWESVFQKGMNWLVKMCHPDGGISFFNDATLGIAPTYEELKTYADQLGISLSKLSPPERLVGNLFKKSGYAVIEWPNDHKLIVDVARVGPDYQPGHAHADTLSCELSLFGRRVLVNSGISQYGEDLERHRQRSTCSHNTVEINGKNSSEVWAGFRVARRAKPFGISLSANDGDVEMVASHNGYRRLFNKVVHHRHWRASANELSVTDNILGKVSKATCHWHFHPDVSVKETGGNTFSVSLADGQLIVIVISGAEAQLKKSSWHPGFGESLKNYKLECKLSSSSVVTQIRWSCN